jgi:hypothetical protein
MTTIKYRDPVTGEFNRLPTAAPGAETLDGLLDVSAPATTPAGQLLGTTGPGAWAPVPQVDAWHRWSGTQAQFDALVRPLDPNTLYVIVP